ncbi:protein phosphatase 2C domain-containing protein [Streptomyces sp. N2-109]|uniref:Protein phosphatase 2C domain-containing protein n=1 Tax=Streptomyces gossypii TaxID=2883101 RepID=A0ABT2JUM6_9ACTN|nr:protein phosphatase 2C domain-containing protein [Streptomyces gossypii]MCT2591578.1 protein phosphatase 2C domain-containing protein [Streptomyces gossypii]
MIVTGAAVQGTSHLAAGQDCQDAFKAVDLGDAAVLALADGSGSRERSALGAHLAVDVACRVLAAEMPDGAARPEEWTEWIAARGALVLAAYLRAARAVLGAVPAQGGEAAEGAHAADVGELAAALVAAVVRPPWAAFLSLGDSFGTVLTRDDAEGPERCHLVLPPPVPGEPPPAFLSSPGAALRIRTFTVWEPGLSGVVLASDGCASLTLDHPAMRQLPLHAGLLPSERFFCGLAATLRGNGGDAEPLRALLSGPRAARTGDDLTVACALVEGG